MQNEFCHIIRLDYHAGPVHVGVRGLVLWPRMHLCHIHDFSWFMAAYAFPRWMFKVGVWYLPCAQMLSLHLACLLSFSVIVWLAGFPHPSGVYCLLFVFSFVVIAYGIVCSFLSYALGFLGSKTISTASVMQSSGSRGTFHQQMCVGLQFWAEQLLCGPDFWCCCNSLSTVGGADPDFCWAALVLSMTASSVAAPLWVSSESHWGVPFRNQVQYWMYWVPICFPSSLWGF